jgi:hypothetical protein
MTSLKKKLSNETKALNALTTSFIWLTNTTEHKHSEVLLMDIYRNEGPAGYKLENYYKFVQQNNPKTNHYLSRRCYVEFMTLVNNGLIERIKNGHYRTTIAGKEQAEQLINNLVDSFKKKGII